MTATASSGAEPLNTVDDDASTRWQTGAAQTPGQTLTVDLGRWETVRRVVLDTGPDSGDFPRGYTLETSRDGARWEQAASGSGTGQLTAINLRPTRARWLRITQTGSAPQWWTVADLRVYR
jgi:glucosylceramidase